MPRPAKHHEKETTLLDEVKATSTTQNEINLEDMPLETMDDYRRYNEKARAMNKKLHILRYPVKQCPVDLHPKQRVVFNRKDQPKNPLPVYKSDEMIEFKKTLIPGTAYDLPVYIVDYLAKKGVPQWDWIDKPNGERETVQVGVDPRFAIRNVYAEA